ncbi:hypothetical protein FOXG_11871 [Fusarium oxysporum f. sp. lycopersici 4287]|uniref:Uncharacterized protein n=3 Tax=Fusarium oxysporum TaxID=5507 RepID=A0A0J9VNL6_FUSO4|nr:hypothetical protein FOXG_11871 [Fusarium oxysporum f. sp. lycopersici 4287]KNB12240.1 hypothetical protein FOXG_11871 [Fusarium oxysporum f. sp. lycopersici 4287]
MARCSQEGQVDYWRMITRSRFSRLLVFSPIARTMASAVDQLRAAGHTIKVIEAPPTMKAMKIAMRWFALDQVNLPFKIFQDGGESPIADLDAMDPGKFRDPGFVADLRENSENISISADIYVYREGWAKIWLEAGIDFCY